ncbi:MULTISPECIES: nucleoside hydrolase [unclassified Lentimonas]|uniref:nucleoside hydrolase n=1 Tax=unclassified Lentimonas TaxID=2630993 RepID=UPI00132C96B3|nr:MULTISPECIES: nucleoside hydrolase [unclassified Lentimonas]CAA6689435.1 Inosine-uridine preferring nucleoside hydrolase (EC [Lentimonas sp. CC10]CAA6696408.1 Inosine-uridine preferring nucleoside hydrolase (EC [Lentimonas sp. CC19]CAA7070500.1 Inosine-uridine preferring nucleoside hydrolase (EC [Lentimonas sp. CC11]
MLNRDALLEFPEGQIRVVLDTDAYNEIDDQFAIVYTVLSPERMRLEAIYAAPFLNQRSESAADGMEKSFEEIERLLGFLKTGDRIPAYRGSLAFLKDAPEPVATPAVQDLIERAREREQGPLYVMAIGAITNVASALLLAPDIVDNVVVVWLGGHADHWPHNYEFNLRQDPYSVRAVLQSGVAVWRVPCVPVADHLMMTTYELEAYLLGKGELADYLCKIFREYREHEGAWSKVIWDIAVVAWLLNPDWVPSELAPSLDLPLEDPLKWDYAKTGSVVRTATMVHRDAVFTDLFQKVLDWSAQE